MSTRRRPAGTRLGGPLGASALVHVGALAAAVMLARPEPTLELPPVYRVQLFAAPPGPRQVGVVQPPPAAAASPEPAAPATPPPAPEMRERAMPMPSTPVPPPRRQQQQATPNTAETRTPPSAGTDRAAAETKAGTKTDVAGSSTARPTAPTAGGGPTGGRGTDVANVNTAGIDFPYPEYLRNVVRQIAVRFSPSPGSNHNAQVRFTIRRDGTVAGIAVVRGSGDYEFDTDARAAVEAAGRTGAFGPLPAGFRDDALTVYFAFDPKVIR